MHQNSAKFVIIGTLKILILNANHIFVSFNDAAIVYVKGSAYRIHFWHMSKDDAINITNNSSLIDKMRVLSCFF